MIKQLSFALILTVVVSASGCSSPEAQRESFNEVVFLLDGSATYKKRREEAVAKASALLDTISQTKVRRWERTEDKITIITVDAVPEVIWQGNVADLKKMKQSDWAERFKARSDYEKCTDVEAAFKLAATHLQGDSRYAYKYVFAFTDLIHEPPASSISSCHPPKKPSIPSEEFPWGDFQDISVSVFWVPPDQKLAWQRAAVEQGMETSFSLYTTSESGQVKISPPPKATPKNAEAEREADRDSYTQTFYAAIKWLGIVLLVSVAGIIAMAFAARLLRGRRTVVNRAQANRRAVPPLPASMLRPMGSQSQAGARPPSPSGSLRRR